MATDKGLEHAAESQIESSYDETVESFDDMSLASELLRGVYAYGFERPSTIQQRAIMPIIKGYDIIAQAQSGTGKTATFCISVLQKIDPTVKQCQALILAPTRELAQQIQKVIVAIGDFMNVECYACFGGNSVHNDIKALQMQDGPQVVVGTPGRIHDMIQRRFLKTNAMKMFILDEADEMLSRGFTEQIYNIFQLLPQSTQVILLSATMPQDVLEVTTKFMHDPIHILVKKDQLTPEGIKQFYIMVEEEWKLNTLFDLCNSITTSTIIFCNTRRKVEWLTDNLKSRNLPFSAIHGDMTAIQRATIMEKFRSSSTHFLIATELLAHGIDVQQIPLVINYEFPANHENYIYRVGRGGYLGRKGIAINFVTPNDDHLKRKIEHFYTTDIEEITTDDVKPHLLAPEA